MAVQHLFVFPIEPKGNDDPFVSPLIGMDNVILTPHMGGSTLEAQDNIGVEVASKLIRYNDHGSTLFAQVMATARIQAGPALASDLPFSVRR